MKLIGFDRRNRKIIYEYKDVRVWNQFPEGAYWKEEDEAFRIYGRVSRPSIPSSFPLLSQRVESSDK